MYLQKETWKKKKILKVKDENSRIRIRIKMSRFHNTALQGTVHGYIHFLAPDRNTINFCHSLDDVCVCRQVDPAVIAGDGVDMFKYRKFHKFFTHLCRSLDDCVPAGGPSRDSRGRGGHVQIP